VSGDFFDYLPFDEKSVGIVVADVSGHGLAPGLLMAQMQAHLRSLSEFCRDPSEMLIRANRFFKRCDTGRFVTMFLGRFDVDTRSFVYAGAGHQAYLLRAGGQVRKLKSTGIPLGIKDHWTTIYEPPRVALQAGDILVIATDGIEEQKDPAGEMFGRDRMLEVVRNHAHKPVDQIVEQLCSAVSQFSGGLNQGDDVTVVIVKVLNSQVKHPAEVLPHN
jgi:sigma-B regulation protein RsbU (phosphoserine phosphatase)